MNSSISEVFIISDLHIGGRSSSDDESGFRICNNISKLTAFVDALSALRAEDKMIELIINGDFIDFLAEEHDDGFRAFIDRQDLAVATFDRIVQRDRPIFDGLKNFLASGHRLTLLLGNHDVELSFPRVRSRLEFVLGVNGSCRFRFIYDGEAYSVGDAIVEHGNRYDGFNTVDHNGLRQLRSLQSRGQLVPSGTFSPPPGSHLVAGIMNPLKREYAFVDLLKPETEAVIPILLALDPRLRQHLVALLRLKRTAKKHEPVSPALPAYGGDVASVGLTDDVVSSLRGLMGENAVRSFIDGIGDLHFGYGDDIASGGVRQGLGLMRLLLSRQAEPLEKRMNSLLEAVRCLRSDCSFEQDKEEPAYYEAAQALASGGYRYVVFGHTHLAKAVELRPGRFYFNTGTWADVMRFPREMLAGDEQIARASLRAFLDDLERGDLMPWVRFDPTYVRLSVRDDAVVKARLCTFNGVIDVE